MQILYGVPGKVHLWTLRHHFVVRRELGREDDLRTIIAHLHPLADPNFRHFVLIVVGCVDEIAASVIEAIKHLETSVFVHCPHEILPGSSEVHGPEALRRTWKD